MIRLHHAPQSRSFRILWLMEEMGLTFDLVIHDMLAGALRHPDYLALSPAGRVPALEIDGRTLFESGVITEYLCHTRPDHGLGRGTDDAEHWDWLEWLHYAETIGQHCANLTQAHVVLRDPAMASPTVMKLEAKRLEKTLEVVERITATRDWLLPTGFSAIDTSIGYGVMVAGRFIPEGLLPAVDGYRERLKQRPACRRALARDGTPKLYTKDFYPIPTIPT